MNSKTIIKRKNCIDIWNAYMLNNAIFTNEDIPIFKSSSIIPKELITFDDARRLVKKDNTKHYPDMFVHFYIDDQIFDGKYNSIWNNPKQTLEILKHFGGVISPDFSTYIDFPVPIIKINWYRAQAFGFWLTQNNINVIQNARWGFSDSWNFYFDCIQKHSNICIGVVGSGLKRNINHQMFNEGILELVRRIEPENILIYGSANYPIFKDLSRRGIKIIQFESKTNAKHKLKQEVDNV